MANLSNINNKFLVTTGGNVLIGQTSTVGSSILQVAGSITANINVAGNNVIGTFKNLDTTANNRSAIKVEQFVSAVGSFSAFLGATKEGKVFLSNDSITANHLLIDTSGNVGIGTPSPDSKLDVKGASATPADGNQILSITNTTGGTQLNLGTAENSYGWIEAREGSTLRNLLLNPNNGNVGIGTDSPGYKLEVAGNVTAKNDADVFVNSIVSGSTTGRSFIKNVGDTGSVLVSAVYGSASTGTLFGVSATRAASIITTSDTSVHPTSLIIGTFTGIPLYLGTNNSPRITILASGNVGIGQTSPGSKFQVEGAPANGVYLSYLYNSATHNSANGLNVQTSSNNILTYGLRVNTAGDSNALAVMGNGEVGIGMASPEAKLTVSGGVGAGTHTHAVFTGTAGRGLALKSGQTGGQHNGKAIIDAQDTEVGGASMDFQIGGSTKLAIDNAGNVAFARNVTINGPSTKFNTDGDSFLEILDAGTNACFIRAGASDELYIGANNNYQLRLKTNKDVVMDNGGNLGIGMASPTGSLEIKANFAANGQYTTSGWGRYLILDAANTGGGGIIWTKQSSTYNRAIVNNQGKMEFGRSTADNASAAWISDLSIDAVGDSTFEGNIFIASTSDGIFLGGTGSTSVLKKFVGNQGSGGAVWTPTVTTTQGTSPTITSSSGYYQQIGNVVTVSFEFTMDSSASQGAGTVVINNLPIAIADTKHVSGCGVIADLGKTINVRHYTATNQIGMNFYDGNYCGTAFRTNGTVTYWAAT